MAEDVFLYPRRIHLSWRKLEARSTAPSREGLLPPGTTRFILFDLGSRGMNTDSSDQPVRLAWAHVILVPGMLRGSNMYCLDGVTHRESSLPADRDAMAYRINNTCQVKYLLIRLFVLVRAGCTCRRYKSSVEHRGILV
jgi:hypothetical protein